jgi:hypothetical protein
MARKFGMEFLCPGATWNFARARSGIKAQRKSSDKRFATVTGSSRFVSFWRERDVRSPRGLATPVEPIWVPNKAFVANNIDACLVSVPQSRLPTAASRHAQL